IRKVIQKLALFALFSSTAFGFHAVTFNAFNRPVRREIRFQKAADMIWRAKPDVVFLQEIGHGWFLWSDALNWIWEGRPEPGEWGDSNFRKAVRGWGATSFFDGLPEGRYATWTPRYGDRCDTEVAGEDQQQLDNVFLVPPSKGHGLIFKEASVVVPVAEPIPS